MRRCSRPVLYTISFTLMTFFIPRIMCDTTDPDPDLIPESEGVTDTEELGDEQSESGIDVNVIECVEVPRISGPNSNESDTDLEVARILTGRENESAIPRSGDTQVRDKEIVSLYLNEIHRISMGTAGICSSPADNFRVLTGIPIPVESFKLPKEKADLIAFFIPKIAPIGNVQDAKKVLRSLLEEPAVEGLRYVQFLNQKSPKFVVYEKGHPDLHRYEVDSESNLHYFPWYFNAPNTLNQPTSINHTGFDIQHTEELNSTQGIYLDRVGYWTWPYFKCNDKSPAGQHETLSLTPGDWLISYTVAFHVDSSYGLLSLDVDLTRFPINQCDLRESEMEAERQNPMFAFRGTHKCDKDTSTCDNVVEYKPGWFKGNYVCLCKTSHHAFFKNWKNQIPGYYLESKWCVERRKEWDASDNGTEARDHFRKISSCQPCPPGCPDCIEKATCMAESNYAFRFSILCISIVCSICSFGLIVGVYHGRKRPIFSAPSSSPIFLCITLFGCSIMYTEMIVLFPVLSIQACIAVKWTRHLGFCITYTALYMKLCRVYLTFRVKSAHKIKLTEKHLLHWMSPIMVIMLLYLFAWTISDPPNLEVMKTHDNKRLFQCVYNWWDHVLSVGEIIFLAYGVFICWRIRDNHDAQFISYSIYNIALCNSIMVTLHLMIVPKAGPDMKYLLAFIRTQMSTTITIALVLGSKVYRAYRGDIPTRKEIANSANGFGRDILDLGEENSQLKEELQKMAMQVERLKCYAMSKNNPHLKSSSNTNTNISDIDFAKLENFTTL